MNETLRGITEDEKALLVHVTLWGSDGYPVRKLGRGWQWAAFRSVNGAPVIYKTKREATAAFEAFHAVLVDAVAGRI